jgi:hypothetical protein
VSVCNEPSVCHPGPFVCHPGLFICHPGFRPGIHAFKCAARRLKHGPRIQCGVTTQVRFACLLHVIPASDPGSMPSSALRVSFACHPGLRAGIHVFICASRRLKRGPRIQCGVTNAPLVTTPQMSPRSPKCHPGPSACHPGRSACHPGLRAGVHLQSPSPHLPRNTLSNDALLYSA